MNTQYTILWVDDDETSTEPDQADVTDLLDGYGIETIINFVAGTDGESPTAAFHEYLDNSELDLIIVDFHMPGLGGDELVQSIRKSSNVYLPVIFYSSAGIDAVKDAVRKRSLDGVYIADRDHLIVKITDVVKSLLNKEQTTKRTRGMLMEGVSEIDATMKDVFESAWELLNRDQRSAIADKVKNMVRDRAKDVQKTVDVFPSEDKFFDHMKSNFMRGYDTRTRWRILLSVLRDAQLDEGLLSELKKFCHTDDSNKSLNDTRNLYAHTTRAKLSLQHSTETCVDIRLKLRSQTSNLLVIARELASK